MNTFAGLVIGGPLDGQRLVHTSNMYRLPQEGELVYRADGTLAAHQPNRWFAYLFTTRYWTPYSGAVGPRDLTSILDELDKVYEATKNPLKGETDV